MRTELQIEISYDQVLTLVKQLPIKDKIKLSKALEKEGIDSKLSGLLKTFRTKKLSLATINEEVEIVRQKMYESKKH
ncbi:MAG: type II toxin-antitoxin system VapB15 family antitoxin [Ferruginibacter sp.]